MGKKKCKDCRAPVTVVFSQELLDAVREAVREELAARDEPPC